MPPPFGYLPGGCPPTLEIVIGLQNKVWGGAKDGSAVPGFQMAVPSMELRAYLVIYGHLVVIGEMGVKIAGFEPCSEGLPGK